MLSAMSESELTRPKRATRGATSTTSRQASNLSSQSTASLLSSSSYGERRETGPLDGDEEDDEQSDSEESDQDERDFEDSYNKKGKKKRTASAPRSSANAGKIDADQDDDDAIDGTAAKRTKRSKPAASSARKQVKQGLKSSKSSNIEQQDKEAGFLFQSVSSTSGSLDMAISEWMEQYSSANPSKDGEDSSDNGKMQAVTQIVLLLVESSGCSGAEIGREAIEDEDLIRDELVRLQEQYQDVVTEYPLAAKKTKANKFRKSFAEFWNRWLSAIKVNILFSKTETKVFSILVHWLGTMSSSKFRPFRHTATTAGLFIISGLVMIAKQISSELRVSDCQLQALSEGSGRPTGGPRLTTLQEKVTELQGKKRFLDQQLTTLFDVIFVHRYRDTNPTIRVECIAEIANWITGFPELYLDPQYLRYIGWNLADRNENVRGESVKSLLKVCSNGSMMEGLTQFTDRFKGLVIQLAKFDTESSVTLDAVKVLCCLSQHNLLDEEDYQSLLPILWSSESKIAETAYPICRRYWLQFWLSPALAKDDDDSHEADQAVVTTAEKAKPITQIQSLVEMIGELADLMKVKPSKTIEHLIQKSEEASCLLNRFAVLNRKQFPDLRISYLLNALELPVLSDIATLFESLNTFTTNAECFVVSVMISDAFKKNPTPENMKLLAVKLPVILARFSGDFTDESIAIADVLLSLVSLINRDVFLGARSLAEFNSLIDEMKRLFLGSKDLAVVVGRALEFMLKGQSDGKDNIYTHDALSDLVKTEKIPSFSDALSQQLVSRIGELKESPFDKDILFNALSDLSRLNVFLNLLANLKVIDMDGDQVDLSSLLEDVVESCLVVLGQQTSDFPQNSEQEVEDILIYTDLALQGALECLQADMLRALSDLASVEDVIRSQTESEDSSSHYDLLSKRESASTLFIKKAQKFLGITEAIICSDRDNSDFKLSSFTLASNFRITYSTYALFFTDIRPELLHLIPNIATENVHAGAAKLTHGLCLMFVLPEEARSPQEKGTLIAQIQNNFHVTMTSVIQGMLFGWISPKFSWPYLAMYKVSDCILSGGVSDNLVVALIERVFHNNLKDDAVIDFCSAISVGMTKSLELFIQGKVASLAHSMALAKAVSARFRTEKACISGKPAVRAALRETFLQLARVVVTWMKSAQETQELEEGGKEVSDISMVLLQASQREKEHQNNTSTVTVDLAQVNECWKVLGLLFSSSRLVTISAEDIASIFKDLEVKANSVATKDWESFYATIRALKAMVIPAKRESPSTAKEEADGDVVRNKQNVVEPAYKESETDGHALHSPHLDLIEEMPPIVASSTKRKLMESPSSLAFLGTPMRRGVASLDVEGEDASSPELSLSKKVRHEIL